MKIAFTIALRYLTGKKSRNIINVITFISIASIMVISAALIIILSAYNGLEANIENVYKAVDPQLKITLAEGKTFDDTTGMLTQIRKIEGIETATPVIEESVLINYDGLQQVGMIKGVEKEYLSLVKLDTMIRSGKARFSVGNQPSAVIGEGMSQILGINIDDPTRRLQVYFPKRGKIDLFNPFSTGQLVVAGIFRIDHEYTNNCMFTSIDFARNILKLSPQSYTGIEIKVKKGISPDRLKTEIRKITGDGFKIENRFEQHALMFRVMKGEKLMVFIIITCILVIASFNLIGVLSLMLVEKRKDLMLLHSLGLTVPRLKSIFVMQGILIGITGSSIGILIGFLIALVQKISGWVKITPGENARAFPIKFNPADFVIVLVIVISIAFLTSLCRMLVTRFDQRSFSGMLK